MRIKPKLKQGTTISHTIITKKSVNRNNLIDAFFVNFGAQTEVERGIIPFLFNRDVCLLKPKVMLDSTF